MRKLAFLYYGLSFLAIFAMFFLGCSLESPEMPSWDVELNLPVLTEDYTLRDLAGDEDAIKVVNDSLFIEICEPLSQLDLSGRFGFGVCVEDFSVEVGAFEINSIGQAGTYFTVGELWQDADDFSGHFAIPSFCFPGVGEPVPSKVVELGDDFLWAEAVAGTLGVEVDNHLPFPLGNPAGGCPLVVKIDWCGGVWDSVVFGEAIPAGGSGRLDISMAGRTIGTSVIILLEGGSAGSDGEVDFSPAQQVGIEVEPRGIKVGRAMASLPAQCFQAEHSIVIEDSTRVVLAGIESGTLSLRMLNGLPVAVWFELSTEDLSLEGAGFEYGAGLPALGSGDIDIDLSGYTLDLGAVGGNPWYGTNTVCLDVLAEMGGSGGMVELASTDSLTIQLELRDLVFDRVTGTLRPTSVEIEEVHEIDLPEIFDALEIADATLLINLRNEAMIGGQFEVEVIGERGVATESAVLAGEIMPAELGSPSEASYEYNGESIRDLVSMVPERIRIQGEATVWGEGRVYGTDAIEGDLYISVPLVFEVKQDTVRLDARDIEVPEDVRTEIEESAMEAIFCGRLVSGLGLSGAFNVYIGADSAGVYGAPLLSIAAPGGFAPFGYEEPAENGEFELHLTREDLEVFLRERLWVGLEITLDASDGQVTARPDDYMRLQGYLRLIRRVDQ